MADYNRRQQSTTSSELSPREANDNRPVCVSHYNISPVCVSVYNIRPVCVSLCYISPMPVSSVYSTGKCKFQLLHYILYKLVYA